MTVAVVDYGMGNRRSVEKALEHVGARVRADRRPRRRSAPPRRSCCPASARSRRRCGGCAALGLDELLRERAAAGVPLLGHLPRHAAAVRVLGRARGRRGARPARRHGDGARRARAEGPAHRLEPRHVTRPARLTAGLGDAAAFYHVHSFACRPADASDVVGTGEYGERFASIVERGNVWACSSTPRSPRATASRCCATSPAARVGGMILYPAIDIRGGRAVRLAQGDFEEETVYDDDPLEAARSWVEAGARYLHVVDLDGARAGEPASLEHLERIAPGAGVPVQYGGGLRTVDAVRDALRAGAERVIVGTAALRDVDFLDDGRRRLRPAGRRLRRRPRREDRHGGLDRDDRAAGRRRDRPPRATRGVGRSSTPTPTATARSGGPTSTTCARSPAPSAAGSSTRAGSARSTTCARCASCGRSTSRA